MNVWSPIVHPASLEHFAHLQKSTKHFGVPLLRSIAMNFFNSCSHAYNGNSEAASSQLLEFVSLTKLFLRAANCFKSAASFFSSFNEISLFLHFSKRKDCLLGSKHLIGAKYCCLNSGLASLEHPFVHDPSDCTFQKRSLHPLLGSVHLWEVRLDAVWHLGVLQKHPNT